MVSGAQCDAELLGTVSPFSQTLQLAPPSVPPKNTAERPPRGIHCIGAAAGARPLQCLDGIIGDTALCSPVSRSEGARDVSLSSCTQKGHVSASPSRRPAGCFTFQALKPRPRGSRAPGTAARWAEQNLGPGSAKFPDSLPRPCGPVSPSYLPLLPPSFLLSLTFPPPPVFDPAFGSHLRSAGAAGGGVGWRGDAGLSALVCSGQQSKVP